VNTLNICSGHADSPEKRANTLNICLGHADFPEKFANCIDLMVSPEPLTRPKMVAWVPDARYGVNGQSLSEYAQLFWVYENLDKLMGDRKFIRIFQYRRFCATHKSVGKPSENNPWSTVIQKDDLAAYDDSFSRHSERELFNTPVCLQSGVVFQYACVHVLEDILNFSCFLLEKKIFDDQTVLAFFNARDFIPACNMGVFTRETFRQVYSILSQAKEFLYSNRFVLRAGYQRRSVGFLLERLNSFLIILRMQQGLSPSSFGNNIIISESTNIVSTKYVPNT